MPNSSGCLQGRWASAYVVDTGRKGSEMRAHGQLPLRANGDPYTRDRLSTHTVGLWELLAHETGMVGSLRILLAPGRSG